MEQIELCQYFKQGVKKIDLMLYNGKATFKHCTDILKFKLMLESWINLNQCITETTYTDYLQKMFDHKNKPFTYNNINTEPNEGRRVYLTSCTKNQKIAEKKPKKPKIKEKKYPKSPKMINISKNYTKKRNLTTTNNDYMTEDDLFYNNHALDDRLNKYSDSSSNNEDESIIRMKATNVDKFKDHNNDRSNSRNKSADYNNINRTRIHNMTPIITKDQFDKKPEPFALDSLQQSGRKTPLSIESSNRQVRKRVSHDIYYDEFYDELGRLHFKGQVKNDLANGFGTLYFVESGNIEYTGQFKDNLLDGNGTLFDQLGNKIYYGDFVTGVRSGIGVEYYASSGQKFYEGQWKNDMWNGWGKVWNLLGEVEYEGKVLDNKPFDFHSNIQKKRNENTITLETNLEPIKEAKIKAKDGIKKNTKKKTTKKPKKADKENLSREVTVMKPKAVLKSRLNTEFTNRATNNTTMNDQASWSSKLDYNKLVKNNISLSEETKLKFSDRNSYCKSGNVSNPNVLERTDDQLDIEDDSKIQPCSNFVESPTRKCDLDETPYDEYSRLTKDIPNFDSIDEKLEKIKKENLLETTEQDISMKANADLTSMQNTSYENIGGKSSLGMNTNLSPINNLNHTTLEETGINVDGTILETNKISETNEFTSDNVLE